MEYIQYVYVFCRVLNVPFCSFWCIYSNFVHLILVENMHVVDLVWFWQSYWSNCIFFLFCMLLTNYAVRILLNLIWRWYFSLAVTKVIILIQLFGRAKRMVYSKIGKSSPSLRLRIFRIHELVGFLCWFPCHRLNLA